MPADLQNIESIIKKLLDSTSAVGIASETMKRELTTEQLVQMLKRRQGNRSQKELADELGVSQQYLCDIYFGRRYPGPKLLAGLGLVRRVFYEQVS